MECISEGIQSHLFINKHFSNEYAMLPFIYPGNISGVSSVIHKTKQLNCKLVKNEIQKNLP